DFGAWQPPSATGTTTCTSAQLAAACQAKNLVEPVSGGGPDCSSVPSSQESSPFQSPANADLVVMDFVTLVGGTTLTTDGVRGRTPGGERGWSGSGGGIFAAGQGFVGFPIPSYQAGPSAAGPNPGNPQVSKLWRNAPDVSMVAINHFGVGPTKISNGGV